MSMYLATVLLGLLWLGYQYTDEIIQPERDNMEQK